MRLIATIAICFAALYAADAHWFGGMYFLALRRIAAQILHYF